MRKIVINASFTHENPTGLGIYTLELVKELLRLKTDFDFFVHANSKELKDLFPEKVNLINNFTSPSYGFKGHICRILWEQFILPLKLFRQKPLLLYSTIAEGLFIPFVKQIITVHDIISVRFAEAYPKMKYYFRYLAPYLLKGSDAIICVSEFTRKEIFNYYDIQSNKPVYVIYEGYNKQNFYPREKGFVKRQYGLEKYIFYVGDMRAHKNLERAIEAFYRLDRKNIKFVIAGKKDPRFYPAHEKKVKELSLQEDVIFLDYVPQEYLPNLYSEAEAFIFPSLYEGFGLPPLEAMACGCPVVASKIASLPEVCGDAACYIDPYNIESIAEGINRVITDKALQESLRIKGLERAKIFSWEKSAKEHLNVFEDVLNKA
ncbi:MAG: glycosyltransferase family 4 protein [Nitrospinae bacterium]|nr:glycosyltransferase family 4 protein [Nitrospinota bacterium]